MKLIYRGVSYDYNPAPVEMIEEAAVGNYRGLEWRSRKPKKAPVLQTNLDLRYRGVAYQTGQTETAAEAVAPVAETVSRTQVKPASVSASAQEQARALMMAHHNWIKNRQQSLLGRAAAEVGLGPEATKYWNHIQGKVHPSFRSTYDRSRAALS